MTTTQAVRDALIASGVDPETVDLFLAWHKAHRAVWINFERFALGAIGRGRKYGAKCILERARFEIEMGGHVKGTLKINNSYASYYARVFAILHPRHRNYFSFRKVTGIKKGGAWEQKRAA